MSIRATVGSSQEPAGSAARAASGRRAERRPCAIHLRGKTEAIFWTTAGSELSGNIAPEVTSSPITGSMISASASRGFGSTAPRAAPSGTTASNPSALTHSSVSQPPGPCGSGPSTSRAAAPSRTTRVPNAMATTSSDLATRYAGMPPGVARSRSRAPSSRSVTRICGRLTSPIWNSR